MLIEKTKNMIKILKIEKFEPEIPIVIQSFLNQLVKHPISFDDHALQKLLTTPNSHLFLLQKDKKYIGMLTVGIYDCPTGGKAWIEDVVIDEKMRGQGFSKLLVAHAIEFVKQFGISTLMLTSNPQRVAANQLYQRMGFVSKETNVYQMNIMPNNTIT